MAIGISPSYAEDRICLTSLREHINVINTTDEYFIEVSEHASTVSSYEITEIQKRLTYRYLSLKNLFNIYNNNEFNCENKILSSAVAVYDFSRVGENIFNSKSLRRVVKGFVKFEDYQLKDYLANYKKFTNKKLIADVQDKIHSFSEIDDELKNLVTQVDKTFPAIVISDVGVKATTNIVAGAARIWGFLSDHTAWREGRLKDNVEARDILETNLRPLDLIFEKRTFLLSNYTIPGHWGHVGIWLGTKQELIKMGVWYKDYFAPFRKYVESGKNIIEIRKEGINYKSLETYMNLDEVAVTRIKNIGDNAKEVFTELSKQLNKKYDFKFDARTADTITCAELITFSYGDISWHETKTLFQVSLRPDDIALSTLDQNPNSEFILYLKGSKNSNSFENLGFQDWSKLFKTKK